MRIKFVNIESASYCEADRISHLCGKPRSFVTVVISIGAIAFALRFAVGWYLGAADFWESGYSFFFTFAKSIASGKGFALADGFPTASRVPLYPIFLAAVTGGHRAFLPLLLAQSLVGAGTVCCAAILAQELFSKRAAVIAAIITALYPYYVVHDTALQETGLYTFLAILSVVMLTRAHRSRSVFQAIISGLALGASVLTRANLAPFAFVAPVWLAVSPNSGPMFCRHRIPMAILCAATLAATVAPWLARSYWLTGTSTLSTQTGFFLWLGNNPLTFSHYPLESIDLSQKVAMATLSSDDLAQLAARGTEAAEDKWWGCPAEC